MRLIFILMVMVLSIACNRQKEDPQLEEAAEVYEQAIELEQQIRPEVDELAQLKNSINVQGRALTPEENLFVEKVEAIEAGHQFWKENHIDVPGHEHHDHEGHGHDHDHGPEIELLPEDMLAVQREFRDTLLAVQERIAEAKAISQRLQNR